MSHNPHALAHATWQRLDAPGGDAVWRHAWHRGWLLQGIACVRSQGQMVVVLYLLATDVRGHTRWAHVLAPSDGAALDLHLHRRKSRWHVNGRPQPAWDHLRHLDLGFTPATNWPQLLTLRLPIGGEAACPALWLDPDSWQLSVLPQHYRRSTTDTYEYTAPSVGYHGELALDDDGLIRSYPGLWQRYQSLANAPATSAPDSLA